MQPALGRQQMAEAEGLEHDEAATSGSKAAMASANANFARSPMAENLTRKI